MRSFRRQLPTSCLAQDADVANGLGYGRFEIGEVDRLGNKVERAAVHSGPDVRHVAVGRHDHGREVLVAFLELS